MKIQLRDYQEENLAEIRSRIKQGYRRVVYRAATGSGKTILISFIAEGVQKSGKSFFFIVHRRELLKQASDTFDAMGIEHGIIAPGYAETGHAVQVCSIDTLAGRIKKGEIYTPDVLAGDEFHHSLAPTWKRVFAALSNPKTIIIGLTATPVRTTGEGLIEVADIIVHAPEMRELIEQGYLCDFDHFIPPAKFSLSGVKTVAGDYHQGQLRDIVDDPAIIGDLITTYRKLADGKRGIYFGVTIDHSKHIAEAFNAAGIRAEHIDGTDDTQRNTALDAFRRGEVKIITNCSLVSEGFDVPAMEVVGMARPTQSLTLYMQTAGRALRADKDNPSKRAIIIDHVGNYHRHGAIDLIREWSLQGKKKRKGGERDYVPPVRQCPVAGCWTVHTPRPTCPSCGHVYEVIDRTPEMIEGELIAVARQEAAEKYDKKRQEWDCRSLEDFQRLAGDRGYNPRWAIHRWNASKHNPQNKLEKYPITFAELKK